MFVQTGPLSFCFLEQHLQQKRGTRFDMELTEVQLMKYIVMVLILGAKPNSTVKIKLKLNCYRGFFFPPLGGI